MSKFIYLSTLAFIFLFPIFSLPFTPDIYEYNKMFLLVFFSLFILIPQSINVVIKKRISVKTGSFGMFLFSIALLSVLSTVFQSPNITVALLNPLSTTTLVSGFLLYIIFIHVLDNKNVDEIFGILAIDACLISFIVILLHFGFIPKSAFTPAGNFISTFSFLLIILSILFLRILYTFYKKKKTHTDNAQEHKTDEKTEIQNILHHIHQFELTPKSIIPENYFLVLYTLSFLMTLTAGMIVVYHLFTDSQPILLPIAAGWIIFVETLKNLKSLLLGVGPSNFVTAFTLSKPVWLNNSVYWTIIFTTSSSFLFTLATETGVFSAVSYLFCIFKTVKALIRKNSFYLFLIPAIIGLLVQVFLPGSMSIYILTIILLAIASERKQLVEVDLTKLGYSSFSLVLPFLLIFASVTYLGGRAYYAETIFKNSLDASLNNRGMDAYNSLLNAIKYNPYVDRYHVALSQTAFQIANAIAGNKNQTKEQTDQIPKFIQQSIDEGRLAVSSYRTNIVNWDNLARIYSSLINYAKGADEWAVQTYQQKILLDPYNPNNKLSLGGILYGFKRFAEAESLFIQAVNLKPDYANAHYNLALAYFEQKKYEGAYNELTAVKSLIKEGTDDMRIINEALSKVSQFYTPNQASESGQLQNTDKQSSSSSQPVQNEPKITQKLEPTVVSTDSGAILKKTPTPKPSTPVTESPLLP
jgi:tetratricopeptide (TPR) repeat protein